MFVPNCQIAGTRIQITLPGCINVQIIKNDLTSGRRQSKTLILATNVDQKSLETEFSIVICRPTGDKWQSKTMFISIFDPLSSSVKSVFDCRLPGVDLSLFDNVSNYNIKFLSNYNIKFLTNAQHPG